MDKIQVIGIVAGILTSASMLPQLVKIIREKKAQEVSILMLLVLISGVSLWIVYGWMKDDLPIMVTNAFSVLINFLTMVFRLRYRHR